MSSGGISILFSVKPAPIFMIGPNYLLFTLTAFLSPGLTVIIKELRECYLKVKCDMSKMCIAIASIVSKADRIFVKKLIERSHRNSTEHILNRNSAYVHVGI